MIRKKVEKAEMIGKNNEVWELKQVCTEKQVKKDKGGTGKGRGRPPGKLNKQDLMEKPSKSVERIESPARNKRGISEVGSPDKELKDLENKRIAKGNAGAQTMS